MVNDEGGGKTRFMKSRYRMKSQIDGALSERNMRLLVDLGGIRSFLFNVTRRHAFSFKSGRV